MPYSITTKDGITIDNIPDNVPPDAPELKERVAKIRAGGGERSLPEVVVTADRETTMFGGDKVSDQTLSDLITGKKPEQGFFAGLVESVTGTQRATTETQTMPEWTGMPELNQLSVASLKTALGTLVSNPKETVQILQANFPGVQVRQDAKGNFILRSSIDQKEYAIPPGFSVGDIPRALGGILSFTPAGRARTLAGAGLAGAGTQAAIETTQAATGGEFDTKEVALAGVTGAGGQLLAQQAPKVVQAVKQVTGRAKPAPAAPAAAPVTPPATTVVQAADQAVVPPVAPAPAAAPASAPTVAPAAAATTTEAFEEVGDLVRKASGKGMGSQAARDRLADLAAVNPEAKAAADRLGLELPFDVFSDNPQVRAAVGLTRSAAGSEAEAAWRTTVSKAVDKADDVIKQFDTTFVEGTVAPGVVSQKVRDSLVKTRNDLSTEAGKIYDRVNLAVPKQSVVTMPKLQQTLDDIITEVGEGGLSAQEKKLLKMLQDGDVTYGRLMREKNLIGQAVSGKESPYGNMEAGALKRLYAALADDQLTAVGEVGGEALRQELRGANLLYAKERALGKRIINAFGEDVEGSIANKMRSALTGAAKGDSADFAKLMKLVPDDLKRETVATALASITRSSRGAERGGFGFSEFADIYPKLRANSPVYAQVVKILGPEAHKTMRDLYEVSKRITEARANVLTTGKANQALVESMKAEGLVGKVMESTLGKAVTTGVAASGGGPIAAAATTGIMNALSSGKKDAIDAAGKLFASDEFQKLAIEAATKADPSKEAIKRLSMSQSFMNFAKAANLPRDPGKLEQWIVNALQTERQFDQENQ
jgi:hypothetical protein